MNKLRLFVLGLLITPMLTSAGVKSQALSEPNGIIVYGEITGEGNYSVYENDIKGLFVKLTVTNASASEKKFLIMSCSWIDNWQTDNQNLRLFYPGCDKDVLEAIILRPQKSIVFYGFLTRTIKNKANKPGLEYVSPRPPYDKWTVPSSGVRVRFGFAERCPENYFNDARYNDYTDKIWWSQPVSLQFNNNSFFVEE